MQHNKTKQKMGQQGELFFLGNNEVSFHPFSRFLFFFFEYFLPWTYLFSKFNSLELSVVQISKFKASC